MKSTLPYSSQANRKLYNLEYLPRILNRAIGAVMRGSFPTLDRGEILITEKELYTDEIL